MKDFRTLLVWQKAHVLSIAVYRATVGLPPDEKYGLISQIKRSTVSIEANIAEGCGRDGDQELRRFLFISMGSANELDCHLLLTRDLGLVSAEKHQELFKQVNEVKAMLSTLIRKIDSDLANPQS